MSVTLTTTGGRLLCSFSTTGNHSKNGAVSDWALFIDGAEVHRARIAGALADDVIPLSFTKLSASLSAGSHTAEVRWRYDDSGSIVRQLAATWGAGRTLVCAEVGP